MIAVIPDSRLFHTTHREHEGCQVSAVHPIFAIIIGTIPAGAHAPLPSHTNIIDIIDIIDIIIDKH